MAKIWIDLDNSPHVPFFAPIIEELQAGGHDVVLTARHAFQVKELADFHGLHYSLVGRHYGKRISAKLLGLGIRAVQLLPTVLRERPALAVSHGSRSQLAVSVLFGIPSLMIADYEHAKTWALIRPTWVMVPDIIPVESIRTNPERVLRYPGIKEDIYVPRFTPDATIRERLRLTPTDIVVTVRPPATEAHYHNTEGEGLFYDVVEHLAREPHVRMILVPRNQAQAAIVRQRWPALIDSSKLILPGQIEDGLNLIWHSDLVISGGGTMNREAAALRVPVYSIFRGPMGAVDRSLESQGRLKVITNSADVRSKIILVRRNRDVRRGSAADQSTLKTIVEHIANIVEPPGAARRPADAA